mmetsp:Transcript_39868/g.79766  ORF Transcript_39868/g.79766 Transcript_39868/m.79766 type:complete len:185 (-) Transcript_39868:615-1169(-)
MGFNSRKRKPALGEDLQDGAGLMTPTSARAERKRTLSSSAVESALAEAAHHHDRQSRHHCKVDDVILSQPVPSTYASTTSVVDGTFHRGPRCLAPNRQGGEGLDALIVQLMPGGCLQYPRNLGHEKIEGARLEPLKFGKCRRNTFEPREPLRPAQVRAVPILVPHVSSVWKGRKQLVDHRRFLR